MTISKDPAAIETENLRIVPQTREGVLSMVANLVPVERAAVSPAWLAMVNESSGIDPWIHGFEILNRVSLEVVGKCGFKGPPDADGMVEVAYGVNPEHEGKGYATEAAAALVRYAFESEGVGTIRSHTFPQLNASTRILTKCGFRQVGEINDPKDGLVWRWERNKG